MKKTKIIIPALGMLLLSTAASVSGTVAWFSMNNQVTVTGMTVTTKVSSNLQIAETNLEANYGDSLEQVRNAVIEPASSINGVSFYYTTKAKGDGSAVQQMQESTDVTFKSYSEAAHGNPVDNNLGATDGTGAANASDATKTGKTNYDIEFNKAYGFAVADATNPYDPTANDGKGSGTDKISFGYVDYTFYIKATSSLDDQVLYMSKCNLLYDGAAISSAPNYAGFAWRVGMFATTAEENTEVADSTAVAQGNLKTILDFGDNSKNQNEIEVVKLKQGDTITASTLYSKPNLTGDALASGTATAEQAGTYYKASSDNGTPKAVNGATIDSKANVINPSTGAEINGASSSEYLDAGDTQRYKIVVRLWLEGEDVSCTSSTFASLTEEWTLDLQFELGAHANANVVDEIGSVLE